MANIELHKSFLGESLVGHVDSTPALSWSDHHALLDTARASQQVADQAAAIRRRLESLDLSVTAVGHAIARLEYQLGYRLESIANVLSHQMIVLEDIALTLRTPAKTRAAERLVDVGELLARKRWKRALAISKAVTDDDPNNPAGFLATAWAHMGLGDLRSAREAFREAADASDGTQRSESGREAARLTLALENAPAAAEVLDRYAITSSPAPPNIPRWEGSHTIKLVDAWWQQERELGAVHYDRAVYLASVGDLAESALELQDAGDISPTFLVTATTDSQLLKQNELIESVLPKLAEILTQQREVIASQIDRARVLAGAIAEIDPEHSELAETRNLIDRLDDALLNSYPVDPPRLRLDGLFLSHLEETLHSLGDEKADQLQRILQEEAISLAAREPGSIARPTQDEIVVNDMCLQMWEVEQPRSGFMRTSRIWLVSTDGVRATVTRLR